MSPSTRAWFQMHFCVVLWGFTSIIGKAITLPALTLVWWRMLIVTAALMLVRRFWADLGRMSPGRMATYAGIGVVLSLHWVTFYGSIKLSNASVAVSCIALTPVFIAFLEPVLIGRSFDRRELLFGIAVVPGVALVVGGTPSGMREGIAVGILSSFFVAILSILNKRYIESGQALGVTGLEMGAGAAFLTLFAPFLPRSERLFVIPGRHDAILLVVLALGCTLLPYALCLVAMRHLTAFSTALAVNMEPLYAIVLAIVLLGEQRQLTPVFYLGVVIILGTVFSHPLFVQRQ